MAAESLVTLGIGSAPGSVKPFVLFGLSGGAGAPPTTIDRTLVGVRIGVALAPAGQMASLAAAGTVPAGQTAVLGAVGTPPAKQTGTGEGSGTTPAKQTATPGGAAYIYTDGT